MPKRLRSEIIKDYLKLANRDVISNAKIRYSVSGGPPGKRIFQEITIPTGGAVPVELPPIKLNIKDETRQIKLSSETNEFLRMNISERSLLFKKIVLSASVKPFSEKVPTFLPDSVIASITIEANDKEPITFLFLQDDVDRRLQNKPISSEIAEIVEKLDRMRRMAGGGD